MQVVRGVRQYVADGANSRVEMDRGAQPILVAANIENDDGGQVVH